MAPDDRAAVRAYIAEHTQGDGELHVRWEAGGDDTLLWACRRVPGGELERLEDAWERMEPVLYEIIDELDLPNAGERYHEGGGRLSLDSEDAIVLEVTARDYCVEDDYGTLAVDDSDGSPFRLVRWLDSGGTAPLRGNAKGVEIELENHHSAESILHRAEIWLIGEMDPEGNKHTDLVVTIINGDMAGLADEAVQYYKGRVSAALDACTELFEVPSPPKGVYIEARLHEGSTARFEVVTDAYRQLRIFDEEPIRLGAGT